MPLKCPTLSFFLVILIFFPLVYSQQPYEGLHTTDCANTYNSSSLLGYFCNGKSTSCTSYLTFHPNSKNTSYISSLLHVDPSHLNNTDLNSNSMLVIPVDCSCSSGKYQYNATYSVRSGDTPFKIANNKFQALSTCQAIINQNLPNEQEITVPLRCACPTTQQYNSGIRYLLSYLVSSGDTLSGMANKFGINVDSVASANNLALRDTIYPSTTMLIPLKTKPNYTQMSQLNSTPAPPTPRSPAPSPSSPPPSPSSPPPSPQTKNKHVAVILIVSAFGAFLCICAAGACCWRMARTKQISTSKCASITN
ncbi:LysM domain receptor-like kinase 4 [Carex littledalei]|uniref:LysM domain receptor-like kinase 4 n=1 Tax=Carex littledalei TaxID=544730 RepID=A0A833QU45_9POAL|nr:LysM domain receptor-like kinase 4 [Carex littledalei]